MSKSKHDVIGQLEARKQELSEAEAEWVAASEAVDTGVGTTDAEITLGHKVDALVRSVERLEKRARAEAAEHYKAEAQRLVDQCAERYDDTMTQLSTACEAAEEAVEAAAMAVRRVGELRDAATKEERYAKLLQIRYPDDVQAPRLAPPPPRVDYAQVVLQARERSRGGLLQPLRIGHRASADEAERRRDAYKVLATFVARYRGELRPEVREFFDAAGTGPPQTAPDEQDPQAAPDEQDDRVRAEKARSLQRSTF